MAAWLCFAVSALAGPALAGGVGQKPLVRRLPLASASSVHMSEIAQRIESGKAAVLGALSGAVVAAPVAYITDAGRVAQWEFDVDMLSLSCALFAITYRYAVREDDNPMLRQGAVGAFALVRALGAVRVSDTCTPVPLRCPPLGLYVDGSMALQGAGALLVGAVAFGTVAAVIDQATARGWLRPSPSSMTGRSE